jgi:hypothetical protein
MVLRKFRWLAPAVVAAVAVLAAPGRSLAETMIIVQETGGAAQTFTAATLPASFSTGNFSDVKITINSSSSATPKLGHSISTTLNATPGTNFDPAKTLTVTVTDDGFNNLNPGGNGTFTGNVSNTSAFVTGSVTGSTTLSSPATTLGPVAATVGNSVAFSGTNVSGVPDTFSITQVLELRVDTLANSSATFTGSISSQVLVNPAAVPAPPAVFLALAAVPVLGLRRVLRKKA